VDFPRKMLLCLFGLLVTATAANAQNHPPVAKDASASSLYRAGAEWIIKTEITLKAEDPDPNPDGNGQWKFKVLNPERLRAGNDSRLKCGADRNNLNVPAAGTTAIHVIVKKLEVICEYQPPTDEDGDEVFQFEVAELAADGKTEGLTSAPAKVTVDIKPRGLRWQLVTGAGQSLSSDTVANNFNANDIPDILGKTNQDFMFNLDWVFRNPQMGVDETNIGATADGHVLARVGYITKTDAVTATPVAAVAGSGTPATGTPEDAVAARRKATFGGEVNYNFVLTSTGTGTFVEFGGLGRGHLDIDAEGDETFRELAGQVIRLTRKNGGVGTFRGEVGGRIALKQGKKDMFRTSAQHGEKGTLTYTRNATDFVSVEFGYQRDEALSDIEAATGVTENRYFVRALFTLVEIPGAPGTSKPAFGVEMTGGRNQPRDIKLLYGADISAIGGLFGVGN
jgi:hypothetical protein